MWLFGYGSLIWKPGFDYEHKHFGYIEGYTRRFWQGSTDHRGVPGRPGRVVTLIPQREYQATYARRDDTPMTGDMDGIVHGVVYKVKEEMVEEVKSYLDHREKGGYTLDKVTVKITDPSASMQALHEVHCYIATSENEEFVGPETIQEIAQIIHTSSGPSGPNLVYFQNLYDALKASHGGDPHLEAIAEAIEALRQLD